MSDSKKRVPFSELYHAADPLFLELCPARHDGARLHAVDPQGQPFFARLPLRELIILLLLLRASRRGSSRSTFRGKLDRSELHSLYRKLGDYWCNKKNFPSVVSKLNCKLRELLVRLGWATPEEASEAEFITTEHGYGLGWQHFDLCERLKGAEQATDAELKRMLGLDDDEAAGAEGGQ